MHLLPFPRVRSGGCPSQGLQQSPRPRAPGSPPLSERKAGPRGAAVSPSGLPGQPRWPRGWRALGTPRLSQLAGCARSRSAPAMPEPQRRAKTRPQGRLCAPGSSRRKRRRGRSGGGGVRGRKGPAAGEGGQGRGEGAGRTGRGGGAANERRAARSGGGGAGWGMR